MSALLIERVKNSLNKQFYTMNDSWLADCIEYYLEDHENPTQEEIITFVMNQWVLCDLREINNEKGCLPQNLANLKCTTLPGKYILQMNKMFDISTSKFKQLEKIRNVSSENVEATENENKMQDDKFQAWEPKSKRMLQLFLTDGVQDILAIEYKPIRFLKDNLYPGFKLMIKGPVTCRKGLILLEETNITEIGGEVDSLLIVNAVENVFARALNLEENPDPYNDSNKQTQNSQSTQQTNQIEDDFDIDSEVIDQIDKQLQNSIASVTRNEQRPIVESSNNANNCQAQNSLAINKNQNLTSSARNQQTDFQSTVSHNRKTQKQSYNCNIQSKGANFEDDDDTFLEMVDEKAFENLPSSKTTPTIQHKSITSKEPSSSLIIQNQKVDDFPMEDEIYDLTEEQSSFFSTSKPQNEPPKKKISLFNNPSSSKPVKSSQESYKTEKPKQLGTLSKNISKETPTSTSSSKNLPCKSPSPLKQTISTPSVSYATDFPDDDFEMDDFDIKTDDFKDYFDKNYKSETKNAKSSQTSSKSAHSKTSIKTEHLVQQISNSKNSTNSSSETKFEACNSLENFGSEFENEFDVEFEAKMDVNYKPHCNQLAKKNTDNPKIENMSITSTMKSENRTEHNSNVELTGIKRLASTVSPRTDAPQKIRCLETIPKDKSSNRKITDFLSKPTTLLSETTTLLSETTPRICELISDVLKESLKDEETHTVVRGKVVSIIKLNLLKEENKPYFHLEGTITDSSASLDVVFSSEVLEQIIGYSPQEFTQKRRQSKTNSTVKDQLREDLKNAQQTLRYMDALMEIKFKRKEKAIIVKTSKLTKDERKYLDIRVQLMKK